MDPDTTRHVLCTVKSIRGHVVGPAWLCPSSSTQSLWGDMAAKCLPALTPVGSSSLVPNIFPGVGVGAGTDHPCPEWSISFF